MAYPTQPAYIVTCAGWEERLKEHPVFDWMVGFSSSYSCPLPTYNNRRITKLPSTSAVPRLNHTLIGSPLISHLLIPRAPPSLAKPPGLNYSRHTLRFLPISTSHSLELSLRMKRAMNFLGVQRFLLTFLCPVSSLPSLDFPP